MQKEFETKSKSKNSINKMNNKGFTIGPYTDAGALKEIQRFVQEKCTEDDDEEEGIINNNENEGEEGIYGEMTPEQLEQLKKLQQIQNNQDGINVDEEHQDKEPDNQNEHINTGDEDSKNDNNISI